MYIEIKENKLLSWCNHPYLDYEFVDIDYETFDPEKYEVQNGVLVDVSATKEYSDKKQAEQNAILKAGLQKQLEELDVKRIRAIAEPGLKNETQTWLEYYTLQIQELRNQIGGL